MIDYILFQNICRLLRHLISGSELLFSKLRNDLNIQNKIQITVQRHNHNYFINEEINESNFSFLHTMVLRKVTKDELDKWLNKNQRSQNKKLTWAFNVIDEEELAEELAEFKDKLMKNSFRSVVQASRMATLLYAMHNNNYNKSKSTIGTNSNGDKIVKKKQTALENF